MTNPKIPTKPGYYWAKWTAAADGTHEGDELTEYPTWCIVEVWYNSLPPHDADDDEAFGVSVPGVRESQWLDCFLWGDFIADLRKENV